MRKTAIIGLAFASLLTFTVAPRAAILESPAAGATLSGIGFISGWKCNAGNITVTIDEGEHLPVAMHQDRGDLLIQKTCGETIRHGFIRQINWGYVGDGEHVVVAYDNGVEFDRATFTVGSTGEEFVEGVRRRTVVDGFPAPGERALLEWNESTQHFELVEVRGGELIGRERAWWQQYNDALVEGTYRGSWFLYVEEPDVDACQPGRLSQAAKNRALEAMNQIRALHRLSPVQYSRRYDEQVQAAALIHAVPGGRGHFPPPSAKCYTQAGAEGSRTSNLWLLAGNADPAEHMVWWTDDAGNSGVVAEAGHRRWVLNPFATYMSYGQVEGAAALKIAGFHDEPSLTPQVEVDYVAFPYKTYPFNLLLGDPPWSFSVVEDKSSLRGNGNGHTYFNRATINVTRVEDGAELGISSYYTESGTGGRGLPNFLSWQVEGWDYDTLYEVEISNVAMQSGATRSFSYPVFIERDNLEG